MLVLAKSNNIHFWLFRLKKIEKRCEKSQAEADPKLVCSELCSVCLCLTTVCPGHWGSGEPRQQHRGPPSGKFGRHKNFPIFPLPVSFPLSLFLLSRPCPITPKYTPHVSTFISVCTLLQAVLGFKEMLCVQSKQKDMEYQQSFIKQLMDLYSPEEPILG